MSKTPIDAGILTNPRLSEKIKKFFAEYTWIGVVVFVLTSYVAFIWRMNDMVMARADVERDLQSQVSELKGKLDILDSMALSCTTKNCGRK